MLPPPEAYDLLIVAGDLCPDYARSAETAFRQGIWMNTKFRDWFPRQNALFTWGNHDQVGVNAVEFLDHTLLAQAQVDTLTEHHGLTFWWSPWSNKFGWTQAFMKHPQALVPHYDQIPKGTDVIVSHAPPYGTCDQIATGHEHLGSKQLQDAIHRVQPRLVVCGHIHGGYGRVQIREMEVINVAQMTERYEPLNSPVLLTLV